MNNKTLHTRFNTDLSRHDSAPTGKDLPLFTYLVNYINTLGTARLIRFSRHDSQCSNLDLHLMVDQSNRHVVKVIDSKRIDGMYGNDVIREIPYSDLQYIMQVHPSVLLRQSKVSESNSGTEVASSLYSVLEVL